MELAIYDYKLIHSRSMGYAMFKRERGYWQQVTKWYTYYGNLKRFNCCANVPCYYTIID